MVGLGIVAAVVAREEGDDGAVLRADAEQLGVLNEIHRVLVMLACADEHAYFMKHGGHPEQHLVLGLEGMEMAQLAEDLLSEAGDMLGMLVIGFILLGQFLRGGDDLFLEGGGECTLGHEVQDEVALEITGGDVDEVVTKAARESEVGL